MNRETIYFVVMGLVVLYNLLCPQIEHRNGLVSSAHHHALVERVEGRVGDRSLKNVKLLTLFPGLDIPDDQLLVLSS